MLGAEFEKKYMKKTAITLFIAGIAILVFFMITRAAYTDTADVSRESIIMLNHIVKTAEENRADLSVLDTIDADFVIVGTVNQLLYSHVAERTGQGVLSAGDAIEKRYPYSYLVSNGKVWGTAILLDDPSAGIKRMIGYITCALILLLLLISAVMILYCMYIRRNIYIPFRNLKEFAAKVAQGKLDEPLPMDRDNLFGAFSESFDIMREELSAAKERELELQKKERELVASLSHDLKTPVTGIKLTAELMQMRLSVRADGAQGAGLSMEEVGNLRADVKGIYEKAGQIDELLEDLFTSTLDDLGEFKVSCKDEESWILADIVKTADDRNQAVLTDIPGVIIHIDRKRMAQVVGNIISNSYKYANTQIDISAGIAGNYLEMRIADHGPGVPASEIDLVTNKFYRGKQWQDTDKDGHGLGLYIARTLMNKMNGDLIAESDGKGFAVTLVIPLS